MNNGILTENKLAITRLISENVEVSIVNANLSLEYLRLYLNHAIRQTVIRIRINALKIMKIKVLLMYQSSGENIYDPLI